MCRIPITKQNIFPTLAASNIKFLKTVVQHTWKTEKKSMFPTTKIRPIYQQCSTTALQNPENNSKEYFFNWNFSISPT